MAFARVRDRFLSEAVKTQIDSTPIMTKYKEAILAKAKSHHAVFGTPTAIQVTAREFIPVALGELLGPATQCFCHLAAEKDG